MYPKSEKMLMSTVYGFIVCILNVTHTHERMRVIVRINRLARISLCFGLNDSRKKWTTKRNSNSVIFFFGRWGKNNCLKMRLQYILTECDFSSLLLRSSSSFGSHKDRKGDQLCRHVTMRHTMVNQTGKMNSKTFHSNCYNVHVHCVCTPMGNMRNRE